MGKALRINLGHSGERDATPTIRPGMVLYGEICYKPSDRETMIALTVNLLGNSAVKAPKGRRELTQLFSVQHPILRKEDEPMPLEVKEYKFPFHFVVPWATEYDRTGMFAPNQADLWTEKPHKVPPTFGPKSKGEAQIKYSISAIVRKRASGFYRYAIMDDRPEGVEVDGIQCIVEVPTVPESCLNRAACSLSPPIAKTGMFRRSSVASETTSGNKCVVTLSGRSVLVLDQAYELRADCRYECASSEQAQSWRVAIKSVDLVATNHRRFRAGDTFVEEESFPVKWAANPVLLLPETPLSRQILISSKSSEIIPSFQSYSISRRYTLRILLLSTLDGGKASAQETQSVTIPIDVAQIGDTLIRRGSTVPPQDINGRTIEPPAYEDSPAYT